MPKTISKALEQRLLRSKEFLQALEDLHHMSGLEVVYVGSLGREKLRVPRQATTILRRLEHAVSTLADARQEARQARLVHANTISPFPWVEVIHPIRIEEEPIGYLVISAWRPAASAEEALRDLWLSWVRAGEALPWKDLDAAWRALPAATPAQLDAWERHLKRIAEEMLRKLEHPKGSQLLPDHLPPLIRQACQEVQNTFRESVTLTRTARTCGVSPEHLSRPFHQSTGLRFREYVTETRIQEGCHELASTSDAIGDVAERNGFSTLSRFNRAFRESTGMTPREWRKRQFRKPRSS
jgi:AraC-like DNA-binding protein